MRSTNLPTYLLTYLLITVSQGVHHRWQVERRSPVMICYQPPAHCTHKRRVVGGATWSFLQGPSCWVVEMWDAVCKHRPSVSQKSSPSKTFCNIFTLLLYAYLLAQRLRYSYSSQLLTSHWLGGHMPQCNTLTGCYNNCS